MASATLSETKHIIKNNHRDLVIHYTATSTGGGNDEQVTTILDFDDASGYSKDGVALASDGFNSPSGKAITGLTIKRLFWSSGVQESGIEFWAGRLEWKATANIIIAGVGTTYDGASTVMFDYTSMGGGFPNPNTSGSNGDIVFRNSNMTPAGMSLELYIEFLKVY